MAITGPESTGKSCLARELALHYNTLFVSEYAREYLSEHGRDYTSSDIVAIAMGQLIREKELPGNSNRLFFCDSDLLVCKIWSEERFGYCDPRIIEHLEDNPHDLYLLCSPDLPWDKDPLRESQHDRERLFSLYYEYLLQHDLPFAVISGQGDERLKSAIKAIEKHL